MFGNLFEVVGKECERGNDRAKYCNIRCNYPANVVDEAAGEAAFDAIETLAHVMAQFIESAVYFVEPSVDGIKSSIYRVESRVDIDRQFAQIIASGIAI
jgi:hypothetical protein